VLSADGVPCGPINSVAGALQDPQVAERDLLISVEHPRFGTVRQVGSPVRVGAPRTGHRRAPARDEHAAAIFAELGYSEERISQLEDRGAFGAGRDRRVEVAE